LVIFEGKQGTGKSSALRCLAIKAEWFTDCAALTQDYKSIMEQTTGKWIVEVPELSGMRKAEVEHIKANLSRTSDRARGAYKEFANDVPRQFIMIGTTNIDRDGTAHYLKDPTGHRRFWPVLTEIINLELLRDDLLQLWAEAAHLEAQGESIVLPEELWPVAAAEQEQRAEADPWLDEVGVKMQGLEGKLPVSEARKLVGATAERWNSQGASRLQRVMHALGWDKRQLRSGYASRAYYYVRGATDTQLYVDDDGRVTKLPG
jgi:predicted P-loop ATPase